MRHCPDRCAADPTRQADRDGCRIPRLTREWGGGEGTHGAFPVGESGQLMLVGDPMEFRVAPLLGVAPMTGVAEERDHVGPYVPPSSSQVSTRPWQRSARSVLVGMCTLYEGDTL